MFYENDGQVKGMAYRMNACFRAKLLLNLKIEKRLFDKEGKSIFYRRKL
jgi:hypothetical protein